MHESCDIAIVGAGAAGLAAAIFAAEAAANRGRQIIVLEAAAKVGAKILISGGGRCNVTHERVHPTDYNGSRHIVRNILAAFDEQAAVRWFADLGVRLKVEATGKLFPESNNARTVLDALLARCAARGVQVLTNCRMQDLASASTTTGARGFAVQHTQGVTRAARVILATGGRSLPRTGSDGQGWEIVRRLGHTVTPTHPALVPLVLNEQGFHRDLSGASLPVELTTFVDGQLQDRRTGNLLWTHFGVSGPVVMDASRHWTVAHAAGRRADIRCNFLPGSTFEATEQWLIESARERPRGTVHRCLAAKLPDRLAATLIQSAGIPPTRTLAELSRAERRVLVHLLVNFILPVQRDRGWDHAEVTAGGVPLEEIDYRTMASRKIANLTLIGEMLDCDGRIGGFNFQWAWATGYLAGGAAWK